jgi:hypothetical protein
MVQNWPLSLNEELQFTKLLAEGLIIIEPFPAIMPFVRPGRRRFVLLACNLSMGDELRSHEVGLDAAYGAQLCTLPQPKHVGHLIVLLKESLLSIVTMSLMTCLVSSRRNPPTHSGMMISLYWQFFLSVQILCSM